MHEARDFVGTVWIETGGPESRQPAEPNGPGAVTFAPRPVGGLDRFPGWRIEATMDEPGWVVAVETAWRGWRVTSGGEELPLAYANRAFLAFHLPAGHHEIDLVLDNTKTTANLVLDAPTGVEAVSKRTVAARVLKNYGELLQALASADPAERVRKPARALADSVDESLGGDWTDEQREAVQELAVGASSYFLAKKKADALKRIVPSYEKPVDALAGLLERDFSLDHDGFLRAYENVARRLKNASIRVINSGSRYSLSDRDTAARALRTAEAALSRATELDRRFSAAVRALRKANRQLVEAMAKREYSWDEIRNYAKQLRELADAYQVLAE
jgi:hypothetical protein